jgi:hypothetical protein
MAATATPWVAAIRRATSTASQTCQWPRPASPSNATTEPDRRTSRILAATLMPPASILRRYEGSRRIPCDPMPHTSARTIARAVTPARPAGTPAAARRSATAARASAARAVSPGGPASDVTGPATRDRPAREPAGPGARDQPLPRSLP